MSFYHGSETRIVDVGIRPVRETQVGVIGLVGTAPMYWVDGANRTLNEPVQILNRRQAAQMFGPDRIGYTIPKALDGIFDQMDSSGGVIVVVVNVLDAFGAQANTTITELEQTFEDDVILLPRALSGVVVKNVGGVTTYVEDTDYILDEENGIIRRIAGGAISNNATVEVTYTYPSGAHITTVAETSKTFNTLDVIQLEEGLSSVVVTHSSGTPTYTAGVDYAVNTQTGVITRLNGAILAGATIKVAYKYVDPSIVQISDIIGETTVDGNRTGLEAFVDTFNLFGFFPKILIAPEYSTVNPVTSALDALATNIDSMAIVDAPLGTAYNDVVSGRGPQGDINFNYASNRLIGCYPHLKIFRNYTGANDLEPMSVRLAGTWANKIVNKGFWWSPSNTELKGIIGTEIPLEFIPGSASTEANNLNSNGIVTYANYFGSGIRTWGNRSFAFPSTTSPDNFINIRFAQIVINERIRLFAMQYVDMPITNALIDAIVESLNAYLRSLINQGGLIDGSRVFYDKNDNPPDQIANGQLVFNVEMLPPPPAERITFLSYLNPLIANSLNIGREAVGV